MLSQTSEYALRAIVFMADRGDQPQTTQQMALATQVPASYLSKVMQSLTRAGLVRAQRGLHGGFRLLRPAEAISVLDVINAVDSLPRIRQCPLGLGSHAAHLCPLHARIDAALAYVEESFQKSNIAELVSTQNRIRPLCPYPAGVVPLAAAHAATKPDARAEDGKHALRSRTKVSRRRSSGARTKAR